MIFIKNNYRVDMQSSANLSLDFLHQVARELLQRGQRE
jgi:hypothetical protein